MGHTMASKWLCVWNLVHQVNKAAVFAFAPHRKTTPLSNCLANSSLLFSQAVVFALGGSFPVEVITMDQTAEVIM